MRKALVVGIDDYPTAPLKGCVNDAKAVAELLHFHENGDLNMEIMLVTSEDRSVTKSVLLNMITQLFGDPVDMAFLYFSGHGTVNQTGGYLVTSDAAKYDEGILMSQVLQIANNGAARDRAIVLDCCNSGGMGSIAPGDDQPAMLADGLTIMTSSREAEPSLEEGGHGVFTKLLIDAMNGGAADLLGNVTPGATYAYVDSALGFWGQRPIFKTNISRFSSWRNVVPRVPVETLRKIANYFESPSSQFQLDKRFEETESVAEPDKVAIFKDLQKYVSLGLVTPVDEEHMYWAAMHEKSCELTAVGQQYWRLAKDNKLGKSA
ncbi:MAG: caspase family protein [Pseudomonadota bacterium]